MKWYKKPIALLGAASVAYHEVMRGRRTGICVDCGRLNHASTEICLCGGEVEANDAPGEHLDDPEVAEYDAFDERWFRVLRPAIHIVTVFGIFGLLAHGVNSGSVESGAGAVFLSILYGKFAG